MKRNVVFILALLMSLMLACSSITTGSMPDKPDKASFIMPVDLYATLWGLQNVVRQAPGTFLMMQQNLVMFAWPDKAAYSFAVFYKDGKPILDMMEAIGCNGQRVDIFTMATFTKFLEGKGWQYITPDKLPMAMLGALQSYMVTSVAMSARALVTIPILVIPSTTNLLLPTPEVVKQ